jgi:hypothetical protein
MSNRLNFLNTVRSVSGSLDRTLGTVAQSVNTFKTLGLGGLGGLESKINAIAAGIGSVRQIGSLLRSRNVATLANPVSRGPIASAQYANDETDWRVKLSLPSTVDASSSELLNPLVENGGLIFPFTPSITINHVAAYNNINPTHSNYTFLAYENSKVESINISADFVCETQQEAMYWTAMMHYFRVVTKMNYGASEYAGSPPPIVMLNGYGDYVFYNVPVVVTNFSIELPKDPDYISTGYQGSYNQSGMAPTKSSITVTVQPLYSREQVRTFNLNDFVSGNYVGQGYL